MSIKIVKSRGRKADELETQVAAALQDLESNVTELKADLRLLYITAAKEVTPKSCSIFTLLVIIHHPFLFVHSLRMHPMPKINCFGIFFSFVEKG